MLNDEVGTMLIVDYLSKSSFHLPGDVVIVKDRHFTSIALDDTCLIWRNERYILFHLIIYIIIIDIDILIRRIEEVAQHCHGTCLLLIDEQRTHGILLQFLHCIHPFLVEHLYFILQLLYAQPFSHGTDDDSTVFRAQSLHQLLESGTLFPTLYLR